MHTDLLSIRMEAGGGWIALGSSPILIGAMPLSFRWVYIHDAELSLNNGHSYTSLAMAYFFFIFKLVPHIKVKNIISFH